MTEIEIHLVDGLGELRIDPNRAAVIGITGKLPLVGPQHVSVLSGKPGFVYRTSEIELALTEDEMLRMMRLDLRPAEVQMLHETYGAFFETHNDFYDEVTFQALQPREN